MAVAGIFGLVLWIGKFGSCFHPSSYLLCNPCSFWLLFYLGANIWMPQLYLAEGKEEQQEDKIFAFYITSKVMWSNSRKQCFPHTSSSCKNPIENVDKKELSCPNHLNNADRFPWQMVGCVEDEGEEKYETAIPAKKRLTKRCVGKTLIP